MLVVMCVATRALRIELTSAGVAAPFFAQLAETSLAVHRYTDSCTRLCQKDLVLSTCLTNSSPVPSSDRLIATTTTKATVMVRFRRRPVQTSCRTNCARIVADPLAVLPLAAGTRAARRSVRLAVHPARLVPHDLAVFQLDDPLPHGVHDGPVVGGHDHGRAA